MRRLLLAIVVLLVVVVALVWTVARTDFGHERLRSVVLDQLERFIKGKLEIDKIKGDLLSDFSIEGIRLKDSGGDPLASIASVRMAYDFSGLLDRRVAIRTLHIKDAIVDLRRDDQGQIGLAAIFQFPESKDEGPSGWAVEIDDFWLSGASVDLSAIVPELGTIDDVNIRASLSMVGETTRIEIKELSANVPTLEQRVTGKLVVKQTPARVDLSMSLYGQGASLVIPTATLLQDPDSVIAMVLVHAEPTVLARLAPDLGLQKAGDVAVSVFSEGFDRFSVTGHVMAGDASVAVAGVADLAKSDASFALSTAGLALPDHLAEAPDVTVVGARIAGNVSFDGRFEAKLAARAFGFGVNEQRIDAALSGGPERIDVRLSTKGAGASLAVRGGLLLGDKPELTETRVRGSVAELSRVVNHELPVRGFASVDLRAKGPLDALGVSGKVIARRLSTGDVAVEKLDVDLSLRDTISAPYGRASVTLGGARTGPSSAANLLDTASATLAMRRDGFLEAEVAAAGPELGLRTKVDGRRRDDGVSLNIRSLWTKLRKLEVSSRSGQVRISHSGRVVARDLSLSLASGTVALSGDVTPTPRGSQIHVAIDARELSLPKLAAMAELEPGLRGRASISGSFELGPRISAVDLKASVNGGYLDYPDAKLTSEIRVERRRAQVKLAGVLGKGLSQVDLDVSARTPTDLTDGEAWSRMGRANIDNFDLTISVDDLAKLQRWWPQSPMTSGDVTVRLHADPSSAKLGLNAAKLRTPWTRSPGSVKLTAALSGTTLDAEAKLAAGELGTLQLSTAVEVPADPLKAGAWDRFDIKRVTRLALTVRRGWLNEPLWRLAGVKLPPEGKLDLDLELFGKRRVLSFRAQVMGIKHRFLKGVGNVALSGTLDRKRTSVQTSVSLDGDKWVDLEGTLAFGFRDVVAQRWQRVRSAKIVASVSTPEIDIPKIAEIANLGSAVGGRARMSGNFEGTIDKPRGRAEVEIKGARYDEVELASALFSVELTDKALAAKLKARQKGGGKLEASARTELAGDAPDRSLYLFAHNFEIGLLASLGPPSLRRMGGRLFGAVTLRGRGDELSKALGKVELRDGSVSLDGPIRRLSEIHLVLTSASDHFGVKARAKAGEGKLAINSKIAMRGFTPKSLDGDFNFKRLPLTTGAGVMELTLEGTLDGSFDKDEISLDLSVDDGLVRMPKGAGRDLHSIGAPTDVVFVDSLEEGEVGRDLEGPSPLPPIVVNLDIPQNLQLRGENISGVIGADIDMTMRAGHTELLGYAELSRGWVRIFRHRYEVERGLASFDATREFDPRLDIVLTHDFKTAVFSVLIQGNLSEPPKPEFRSEPALYDDSQLLSFFLGGSPDDVARSRSNSARAAGAATSLVTSKLTGIVEEILPVVDVLSLESTDESATPDQLLAGKWLTEKVLIAYRARLSAKSDERTNVNELTVEWWFLRRWLLQIFYGDRQVGAIDALWIRRF